MSLESFDTAANGASAAVKPEVGLNRTGAQLRRLERKLQPREALDGSPLNPSWGQLTALGDEEVAIADFEGMPVIGPRRTTLVRSQPTAWGVRLLLAAGGMAIAGGLMLLVAANLLLHAAAWRWGFAVTTAGEALVIAGLAATAIRLWRNSRRLNSQLEGLDRRLELVQTSLALPASRRLPLHRDAFRPVRSIR
ncbi:MAG: hypothetical protein IT424_11805 [Pirellulales bacterium]|nr:hypothetical protein [Pirellulales bacterium]